MKAAIVEGPNKLVVKEVCEPPMGDYDALCEMLYGATCTGTDSHIIDGSFAFSSPCPTILGHESVGRVIKLGPKVRHFKPGDVITRVGAVAAADGSYTVTWGGFATRGIARDHWAMAVDGRPESEYGGCRWQQVLPPGVDPAEATLIMTWRETLSYVTRMGVKAGSKVLVIGSGGNGLAFANHAANMGAPVVGMIGSPLREAAARAVGVGHFVPYKAERPAELMKAATDGGFDFAIDAVGRQGNLDLGLSLLRTDGTLAMYGMDDFGTCVMNPGGGSKSFRFYNGGYDEEETHGAVMGFLRKGKLQAKHWLDLEHPAPLDDIADAFADLAQRKAVKRLIKLT